MLDKLDLTKKLKRREWRKLRPPLQRRLYALHRAAFMARLPALVLLEGWAGAGKGAAIQTLTYGLDPRGFQAWRMRRPDERDQPYPWLRRYWLRLPARGDLALFDGAWYGQVLTELVENHMGEDEARSAYRDCLDLERMLADDGHAVIKIWLHISQEEQRRRLRAPTGETLRWPGSRAEDWRQYRKHRQYLPIVEEMLEQTDVDGLRWNLIPATNPSYTQWSVMQTVVNELGTALARAGIDVPDEDTALLDPQAGALAEDEL